MLDETVSFVQEKCIETLLKFKQHLRNKSGRAADILNMVLRRKLSQDSGDSEGHMDVSMQSLLGWKLWPVFIELFAGRPQYKLHHVMHFEVCV